MSMILKKLKRTNFTVLVFVLTIIVYYCAPSNADDFHRVSFRDNIAQETLSTFTKRLSAAGGNLNTVKITIADGDGPMILEKAYVFVDNGLNAGNVHLHNVIVDGVVIAHFNMGELTYLTAPSSEEAHKARGGELTHMLTKVMNIDQLHIAANKTIDFDFMAAGTNDPNPTTISVMLHVRSHDNANITVELEE